MVITIKVVCSLYLLSLVASTDSTMQQRNVNNSIYKKSLTKNLFGQLAKLNNLIINQETTSEAKSEENLLEFDKNDQLISRSESESRIIIIFAIMALINQIIIFTFTIVASNNLKNELKVMDLQIPIQFKMPFLQIILNNGSVYSSNLIEDPFFNHQHQFDLPRDAHYYYSFDYRGRMSYIHGKSKRNYLYQTFKNIQSKKREKKHKFPGEHAEDTDSMTGFNCSIVQAGPYLMLFGGGIDRGHNRMFYRFLDHRYVLQSKNYRSHDIFLHF